MKLGRFRELTENIPDDAEVVIWEDGDATWYEANVDRVVSATATRSPVLVMDMGQKIELEFDLAARTGIDG